MGILSVYVLIYIVAAAVIGIGLLAAIIFGIIMIVRSKNKNNDQDEFSTDAQ